MQGGIRGPLIPATNFTNYTKTFECHPKASNHGSLLLSLASIGVAANAFLAALILTRRSLRRWSSGLLLHGTFVDGARAALLIPLALSVLKCHPVTKCSLVDTAFLLLATVTSLNLLTASLSDAPLLPPPVLVTSLLQSAGYSRPRRDYQFASPLYPKGEYNSYYSDYYEEDANLLAETTAMPDSPQCILFGTFMVWFAALTINLGPTFLSGALAAQADAPPRTTSCPLVRGPARHVILNALWAAVNLLCVGLAAAHLRKLKKELTRAHVSLIAAAGAGLAGMTGINNAPSYAHTSAVTATGHSGSTSHLATTPTASSSRHHLPGTSSASHTPHGSSHRLNADGPHSSHHHLPTAHHHHSGMQSQHHHHQQQQQQQQPPRKRAPGGVTAQELDAFIRQAQRNGRCHIRTLGTLAVANLLCWVPLYICALVAPVGTGVWEDPAPFAYEITLMAAFAHSAAHPVLLLILHQPLRAGFQQCIWDWCCFVCNFFGMDFDVPSDENSPQHSRAQLHVHMDPGRRSSSRMSHHSHHSSHSRLHTSESLVSLKRSSSLKSNRSHRTGEEQLLPDDLMLPPPPPPASSSAFRKQVSLPEDPSPPPMENRW